MTPEPLLDLIHVDPDFVVVNKEGGMLSVPGRDVKDSVTNRVRAMFPDCKESPEVHRLDMDTSGLMVVARTVEAHRHLSIQFQDRLTQKKYQALLEGKLDGDSGTIELPFRLDIENRPIQIYDEVHGKVGITHWEKIGIEGDYTRVMFIPITGRTHQLRVHSAHPKGLGIPIVGDPFYGNGNGPGQMKLHACELSFTHPTSGKLLTFRSESPF